MMRMTSLLLVFSIAGAGPAIAVSQAVREACTPDAKRLCGAVIHDTAKRQACMRAHVTQLSKACIEALRGARAKAAPATGANPAPADKTE
jgi:hypothetical protein